MDQSLLKSSCDKDSIKMAMLRHEELFKQQVQELHRLYEKQKLLMKNIQNIVPPIRQNKEQATDLDSAELIEESEIELTLGPSIYKSSHNNNKRSRSGQTLSSSNSTGSSQILNKESTCRKNSTWEFTQNSIQMNVGDEHLRQDRMDQHPPWMFQALSLKLT